MAKDVTHTMTFSIADDSDSLTNSQVFLQSGTFGTTTYGCMDPEALNFDSEALEDDASCAYIASAAAFVSVRVLSSRIDFEPKQKQNTKTDTGTNLQQMSR